MRTKLAVNVLAGLVAVPLFALTTSVYATPTLFLSDGVGDTVEISENSTLNTDSSVPGTVSWSGSLGVWNLNVSTGVSSGTGTSPSFDLNSIDAIISPATGGPYTLQVWFGDANLGSTTGSFVARFDGTTAGTVTYNTYADPGNTLFAQTLGLTSQSGTGPFSTGPFSGSESSESEFLPLPYSLSQEVIITQTSAGSTSINATLIVIPEPETITLAMFGLIPILSWLVVRSRR